MDAPKILPLVPFCVFVKSFGNKSAQLQKMIKIAQSAESPTARAQCSEQTKLMILEKDVNEVYKPSEDKKLQMMKHGVITKNDGDRFE